MAVVSDAALRAATRSPASIVAALRGALTWPIVSLLITGMWHFTVEAIWPDLRNLFVPAVLAPILLAYGAWAGQRTVSGGGSYVAAIVAGAILGVLPLLLDTIGFGVILGRGSDAGLQAGIFGFSVVLFGALLGGGYAMSRQSAG
jgi:hypothetical protein